MKLKWSFFDGDNGNNDSEVADESTALEKPQHSQEPQELSRRNFIILTALGAAGCSLSSDEIDNSGDSDITEDTDVESVEAVGCSVGLKEVQSVKEILNSTEYSSDFDADENFRRFVATYEEIFSDKKKQFFYYDAKGNVLLRVEVPANWDMMTSGAKQAWHNTMRQNLKEQNATEVVLLPNSYGDSNGYPFVAVNHLSGPVGTVNDADLEDNDSISDEIVERLKDVASDGARYFNGKQVSIYDAIRLFCEAYDVPLEAALGVCAIESGVKKDAVSEAGAHGLFQFLKGTFDESARLANASNKADHLRSRPIGSFENEWQNRFVQAELFCVHYNVIRGRIRGEIDLLEERLRKIDPNFSTNFEDLAILTAYNAGCGRVNEMIKEFRGLSNREIKKHIGEPSYGRDVWMGVLGRSFGTVPRVGKSVFHYAIKTSAMGYLLAGTSLDDEDASLPVRKIDTSVDAFDEEVLEIAKADLDKKYAHLKKRKVKDKLSTTQDESDRRRKNTAPAQRRALTPELNECFGATFVTKFNAASNKKKFEMYDEGSRLQTKHIDEKLATGELVKMKEEGENYFCEQVGVTDGTKNNSDSLIMHSAFKPLLKAIVELVNYQIDIFNEDPAKFGHANFPYIPHITKLKVSGAFRPMNYQKQLVKKYPGRTTTGFTPHSLGMALDLASYATASGHMVEFEEPFVYEGETKVARGGKLKNSGFGKSTRDILSRMVGRALMALEKPLSEEGVKLMYLWEQSQLNHHVSIKVD
ncbi:transglycosylase SLT domain-containing protein [Patescibacteria group bacterium]|nr:transglycosylase SLT domain-containing protein [Patescibacteria group bacterium]